MKYVRLNVKNENIDELVELYALSKAGDYDFSDLIYLNKNGKSITEDMLKIRVYKDNQTGKDAIIIRKEVVFEDGLKDDETILSKELDTENEAIDYVDKNFEDYEYKFKLKKRGTEYTSDDLSVCFEDVEGIGKSVEIGGFDSKLIEEVVDKFDVIERLNISLPEYAYNKFIKNV